MGGHNFPLDDNLYQIRSVDAPIRRRACFHRYAPLRYHALHYATLRIDAGGFRGDARHFIGISLFAHARAITGAGLVAQRVA